MTANRRSTFTERQAWLRKHPELKGKKRSEIVSAMKRAGLVSVKTYNLDVRIFKEKGKDVPE